ncbi:MAG: preprotein translocase subunit SecE [Alphaproteobacteria bacterium]
MKFIRQVQAELKKVTWPTRKETMVSTVMVLVMVVIAMFFFLAIDLSAREILDFLYGLGGK